MKEEIKHKLNKGILFLIILVVLPLAAIIIGFISVLLDHEQLDSKQMLTILLIFAIPILLVYTLCLKTYYKSEYIILGKELKCKMGVFSTKIQIDQINYITEGEYSAAGNRPALNMKGLKINYGAGYSIFLSPQEKNKFIQDLKAINNKIEIRRLEFRKKNKKETLTNN